MILFIIMFWQILNNDTIKIVTLDDLNVTSKFETLLVKNIFDTYRKKENKEIPIKYIYVKKFENLFSLVETNKLKDNIFAIANISISPERQKKFDFSKKYMDAMYTLVTLKNDSTNYKKPIIGIIEGTIDEKIIAIYQKKHQCVLKKYITFSELVKGFYKKDINYMLADNVQTWTDPNLKIIYEFNEVNNAYGMMFPKNSTLKNKLEVIQEYLLKSKSFLNQLREEFGDDAYNYFNAVNK